VLCLSLFTYFANSIKPIDLCTIVQSYVSQLEEEEAAEISSSTAPPMNVTVMNTAPVPIHAAYDYGAPPAAGAGSQYAFSQPQHSYGGESAYGKV
jgi:hypothetical protein